MKIDVTIVNEDNEIKKTFTNVDLIGNSEWLELSDGQRHLETISNIKIFRIDGDKIVITGLSKTSPSGVCNYPESQIWTITKVSF